MSPAPAPSAPAFVMSAPFDLGAVAGGVAGSTDNTAMPVGAIGFGTASFSTEFVADAWGLNPLSCCEAGRLAYMKFSEQKVVADGSIATLEYPRWRTRSTTSYSLRSEQCRGSHPRIWEWQI